MVAVMESCPVSAIPTELLAGIFAFLPEPNVNFLTSKNRCVVPYYQTPTSGTDDNLGWLTVAGVCKLWRDVALTQTSRPIPLPTRNKAETAQLFQSLDPLPFEVHVSWEDYDEDAAEAMDYILSNAGERLYGFTFFDGRGCYPFEPDLVDQGAPRQNSDLNRWLSRMDTVKLRKLHILALERGGPSGCVMQPYNPPCAVTLPANAPLLEDVTLRNCNINNRNALENSSLRTLNLIACPNALQVLSPGVFSQLERLRLTDNTITSFKELNAEHARLHFPRLKELSVASTMDNIASLLSTITFPVDASVDLNCGYSGPETDSCPLVKPLTDLYSATRTGDNHFTNITITYYHFSTRIECYSPDETNESSIKLVITLSRIIRGYPSRQRYRHAIVNSFITGFCASTLVRGKNQSVKVSCDTFGNIEHSWLPAVSMLHGVEKLSLDKNAAVDLYTHLGEANSQSLFPRLAELNISWGSPTGRDACTIRELNTRIVQSSLFRRDQKPQLVIN